MFNRKTIDRRTILKTAGASATAALIASCVKADGTVEDYKPKGNLKQSVCKWCYRVKPADSGRSRHKMGLKSVELLTAEEVPDDQTQWIDVCRAHAQREFHFRRVESARQSCPHSQGSPRRDRFRGGPGHSECHLHVGQSQGHGRSRGHEELRGRTQEGRRPWRKRRRSPSSWKA